MPETVEYCLANVDPETRRRLRGLDCSVEKECLQRCDACCEGPHLVVDGEHRTAESYAELLAEVEGDA